MEKDNIIRTEDYNEPRCVLLNPETGLPHSSSSLPLQRIMAKLDEYCDRKDFIGAERHLEYWLSEAVSNHDLRGQFAMRNEMMGFYRKQGNKEKAVDNAIEASGLIRQMDMEGTDTAATCYTNCGTVYDAFGMPQMAIRYFLKAKDIFEASERTDGYKVGSLYNNLALALADDGGYEEAIGYYEKALSVMEGIENGILERAITYINMSDAYSMWNGLEASESTIKELMDRSAELFDSEDVPRDGYYAFVCEKCAPGFYCHGRADVGRELEKRAEEIYANIKKEQ